MSSSSTISPAAATVPAPARTARRRRPGSWRGAQRLLSSALLILVWQGASSAGLLSGRTLASPAQIAVTAWAVAEQVNATAGIGYLINDARDFLRTDVIEPFAALDALTRLLDQLGVREHAA